MSDPDRLCCITGLLACLSSTAGYTRGGKQTPLLLGALSKMLIAKLLLFEPFVRTRDPSSANLAQEGPASWTELIQIKWLIEDLTLPSSVALSSVQSLSRVWLFVTPWTAACQASLSITDSWSLLKLMSIELVMVSNHLIFCHPLLLPSSIFPSIRVFSNESVFRIRWPKYWSFSFKICPSNDYSGLISFRMDWLDLLAVQGTLKSPPTPQFKSINSSVLSLALDKA